MGGITDELLGGRTAAPPAAPAPRQRISDELLGGTWGAPPPPRTTQQQPPPSPPAAPEDENPAPYGISVGPGLRVAGSIPRPVAIAGSGFARGLTTALGAGGDFYDWFDRFLSERSMPAYRDTARNIGNFARRQVGAQELLMPPRINQEGAAASGPIAYPVQPPSLVPEGMPRRAYRPLGLPSSEELQAPLRAAGVIDNPSLEPQTESERYIARGGEFAGSFPAGPRAIAAGITAGLSSQAAREFNLGPWAELGAGLVGGVGGHAVAGVGTRLVNAATGRLTPLGEAYRTANIPPRMVGDVGESATAQRVQATGAAMPGGTGVNERAANATLADFTTAIDRAANQYGNARTAEQAGGAMQTGARNWVPNWQAGSARAWDDVLGPNILPPDALIPVNRLRNAFNAVGQRMRDVPEVGDLLRSDRFTALRDAINRSPQEWRSESVRTMRTIIGQLNEARGLTGDIFTRELDQIYAALSEDIRQAVSMRPGGLAAWEWANAVTRTGHEIMDNVVTPLLGRTGQERTAADAYRFATSQINARAGGGERVGRVADITGAGGELAASLISQAGQRVGESRSLVPFSQLTDPRSARGLAPEAAGTLFGQPGSHDRRLMTALDDIARGARGTERFLNTSRTGPTLMMGQTLASALPTAVAAGGALSGHIPLSIAAPTVATALGTPLAGYLAARATTDPRVARYMTGQPAQPAGGRGLLNQLIQTDITRLLGQ